MITMTHSILEPNALAIRTKFGTVFHTGDWKIDPEPLLGDLTDEAMLKRIGDEGALAMVCDSTNVFVEGEAGSEATVRANLEKLVQGHKGRVAVTCFASNLARVESIALAAVAAGRHPGPVGPRPAAHGRGGAGMRLPARFSRMRARAAGGLPAARQGAVHLHRQPGRAAGLHGRSSPTASIATWSSRAGDTAIFSSRVIPGNEHSVGRLQNALMARGVKVITDREADIHVSGHPARDELVQVYQWIRPKIALPVHGEVRHMIEHAALARTCQVPETIVAPNGTLVRLAPGPAEIIDHVLSGRLARDGDGVGAARRRVAARAAQAPVERRGGGDAGGRQARQALAPPKVSLRGIDDEDGALGEAIVRGAERDAGRSQRRRARATTGASRRRPARPCGASCARTSARSR